MFGYFLNVVSPQPFPFAVSILVEIVGVVFGSLALSTYVQLNVGVQPLDMIVITIKDKTGLTYGKSIYIFNVLAFIIALILRGTIGVGTIINFLLGGKVIDIFTPKVKAILTKISL